MNEESSRADLSTPVPGYQCKLTVLSVESPCTTLVKESEISAPAILAQPAASPDLAAYKKAISAPFPEVVKGLSTIIGRKLTAYIASVTDARAIERWIGNAVPNGDTEPRLRLAYRVAFMLSQHDSNAVVQAWTS